MAPSRRSSTAGTTSDPTELDVLRALAAPDLPFWSAEPLAEELAQRMGTTPRALRSLLAEIDITLDVPGGLVRRLDETWLLRTREPFDESAVRAEGVIEWAQLGASYVIVRTFARDAVERERRLRDIHARLGERPLAQLERPVAAAPARRLAREDWALLAAARASPFAPLDALASAAGVGARVARARLPKLVAERALRVAAAPRAQAPTHVLVRVSPSSSAAAQHALACFAGLLRAWVPAVGEASLVDAQALAVSAAERERALDVPGVARVEALPQTRAWRDDAALDALLREAALSARGA